MFMTRLFAFIASTCLLIILSGCESKYLEVDEDILQSRFYEPYITKYVGLQQSTVLYLDHSTCVIEAVRNSEVFRRLRPDLGQYCDTLRMIKGDSFESISLNREDNRVSEALETIETDIPYADIRKAVFDICNDNQQAILISDCESYANGRFLDLEPYMSEPFKNWLADGHSIYIITEPYTEKHNGNTYEKKRFYIVFTDDRMKSSISNIINPRVNELVSEGVCSWFKMTNSDIRVQVGKSDLISQDLSYDVKYYNGFEYIEIDDSWDDIRRYVMRLDKYGEQIPDEKPEALVRNIRFSNGENYIIKNIDILATNITSKYIALSDSTMSEQSIDMSNAFMLDKEALKRNIIDVLVTDKIFTDGYLMGKEYGGNLIRLDFVIPDNNQSVHLKEYDSSVFQWQSVWVPETAICVSRSIDNALRDANVVPSSPNRRVIHTVFIKTSYY